MRKDPKPVTKALECAERVEPSMTKICDTGMPVFSASAKIAVLSSESSKSVNLKNRGRMNTGMRMLMMTIATSENPIKLGTRAEPDACTIHKVNGRINASKIAKTNIPLI